MIIDQLRRHPLLQLSWTAVLLIALSVVFAYSEKPTAVSISPFLSDDLLIIENVWVSLLIYIFDFVLLFSSLFQLSSLLRNYHFTGDSRFDILFLLVPFLVLFPTILFHPAYIILIFFLQQALKLQFNIHTQIRINREIALIALNMSMAALFFPKALIIALVLYLGIIFQRGFYLKELLIYLIVLALPFYFIYSALYLLDLPFLYNFDLTFSMYDFGSIDLFTALRPVFALVGVIVLLKSLSLYSKAVLRAKAQLRNFYTLLILGLIIYFIQDPAQGIAIASLPIFAIFAGSYPELYKKWVYEIILILLFIGSIVQILIPA